MKFLDTSRIRTLFDERVVAPDGTELSVDIYLPADSGQYPVLLNRTPADNNNRSGRAGNPAEASRAGAPVVAPVERWKALAAQGFIVAAADVRGRGDSDGRFTPFVHEGSDGAATVSWLQNLSESNGKITMFGSGYAAHCAWAAADAGADLAAIVSISPFGSVGDGLFHRSGAIRLDWLFWMHLIGGRTIQPANVPNWPRIFQHAPIAEMETQLGRDDVWWAEWLKHLEPCVDYWAPLHLLEKISALKVPALHVTGWWDGQASAAWRYFEAASCGAGQQTLLVGPWDTAAVRRPTAFVGGIDFGPRSVLNMDETMVEYVNQVLEDNPTAATSRYFITGRNEWVAASDVSDHSLPRTFHLASELGANTRRGDGVLAKHMPRTRYVDSVCHNPASPVMWQPQFRGFVGTGPALTLDQAHITSRDEALVYTSPPFEVTTTAIGRPIARLSVRVSSRDADLFVLVSDVFPFDGRDLNLTHGALRLGTHPDFRPGERLDIQIELDPIAHDFLRGHAIRLTIVPSLFPLYARNLQSGDYVRDVTPSLATLEFDLGPECEASLELPHTWERDTD